MDSAIKATRLPLAFYFASESAFLLDETGAWLSRSIIFFLNFGKERFRASQLFKQRGCFSIFLQSLSLCSCFYIGFIMFFFSCIVYSTHTCIYGVISMLFFSTR